MSLLIKISLALLALASTSFGADTIMAPPPPSIGFSVVRVVGALCLVFSLLFGGVWVYRNSARFAPGRGKLAKLKVLESRALGHRHSIFVVGYENQRLLLSTSPTGVTMLSHLPEATAEEVEAESTAQPLPSFSTAFLQALTAGRK
jgi:flagellar biogenesis protein FliO